MVSGTASGGAYFVVKPNINSAADLKGKKIGTPQAGNTQDVALRTWLNNNGLHETKDGGDVTIVPEDNSVSLTAFQSGAIDGAWVPEPWATRLVTEGGGKILVDEKTLWPKGQYVTTLLMVKKEFLDKHPDVIQHLISGLADSIDLIKSNPTEAKKLVGDGILKITGKPLKPSLIDASFSNITFTLDPIASSLQTNADNAKALGFLKSSDLGNIFDLTTLNNVLKERGEPASEVVTAPTELEPRVQPMAAVSIADVSKVFGNGRASVTALDHISLDVAPGEFVCLLGASGCGKSTLLNIVAGLDQPTSGQVSVRANHTGLMFQEAALFPWLTARGNVELALKLAGVGRDAAPRPYRPAARDGAPRRVRQEAAARAVRRHAPTGRARPRARAGRGSAADGRTVRCARRDDARSPARRARNGVARHQQDRDLRDAQRARGGTAR